GRAAVARFGMGLAAQVGCGVSVMAQRPGTGRPVNRLAAFVQRLSSFRLLPMLLAGGMTCSAATFYVTIAGLGGEPDYEQRFAQWASELDSILKSEGRDAKISTLKGPDAARANVRTAMEKRALEAFNYAENKATEYYESQKRLSTEHPMLEDTGKGACVRTPS